jgi:hypothetical protein
MKVNSKSVKTKHIALTNDIKEIVLAKISTKQAIMVAIISLLSAVAVTAIANLDKLRNTKNIVSEETGYYEGRASIVESAFSEEEEEVQTMSKLAQLEGRLEQANLLKDLNNELRENHVKFQELHTRHIEAITNEKRLSASRIRAEANEVIWRSNRKGQEVLRYLERNKGRCEKKFQEAERRFRGCEGLRARLIPNYGKGLKNTQELVCNAD